VQLCVIKQTFIKNHIILFMAKSKETFNKKEKEKKRLKQRQDKEEKMQERKASGKKGSLDDMLAYIDENGNITSTPPDPGKKKIFKTEDIQIGVPKQVEGAEEDVIRNGTVTFFNSAKGFGFIKDSVTEESVFVHINQLSGPLKENEKVTFEVEKGPRGLTAVNVTKK
jgi:cold shock CspA family protein